MRNTTIVAVIELLLCLAIPAYGQIPPHPWSGLTGIFNPPGLGVPARIGEVAWVPARVTIWVTPLRDIPVWLVDVPRTPTIYEFNLWSPSVGASGPCLLQTLAVDLTGGEQQFDLDPKLVKQAVQVMTEGRPWVWISRVEAYDAAGKLRYPTAADNVVDVKAKVPVPRVSYGPASSVLQPSIPQFAACGGGPIVIVPPRHRPSGKP